uniref:Isocitrate dehydrogenase [NADP] n=1 Tax=Solanum tuberosum TaxID=4113 RepID=M1B146_SOLTU
MQKVLRFLENKTHRSLDHFGFIADLRLYFGFKWGWNIWCRYVRMERLWKQKQPMELLHATTGFIRKEVKPAQIALPRFLLGLVDLHIGRTFWYLICCA